MSQILRWDSTTWLERLDTCPSQCALPATSAENINKRKNVYVHRFPARIPTPRTIAAYQPRHNGNHVRHSVAPRLKAALPSQRRALPPAPSRHVVSATTGTCSIIDLTTAPETGVERRRVPARARFPANIPSSSRQTYPRQWRRL